MTEITIENLEKIGLKAWQHPTKSDDIRYYFNAKYYINNEYRIISRSKDSILYNSKIYFTKNLELKIFPQDEERYLNKATARAYIKKFIIKLIDES